MGNIVSAHSSDSTNRLNKRGERSRVLFLLHRTWAVIVTDKWYRSRVSRRTVASDSCCTDYDSQYSFCSCSQCQRDDGFSSGCDSVLFEGSTMAPNSEESDRIGKFPFGEDTSNKDKQRPPIYNPEDYAHSLRKWGKKQPLGAPGLYSNMSSSDTDICSRSQNNSFRDYRNPMLTSLACEMTLRQFGTVTELLNKLKADLRLAYPSFIQEFVADPLDGVSLLLELLRVIQLNQTNNRGGAGSSNTTGKIPPAIQRKALLDELSCLQCLHCCCLRYAESIRKLTVTSAGLYTLAVCIMSNVNKSRIIALQLLGKACEPPGNGHSAVSEALSTLRLRFGEPVRFRFLVGMLNSAGGHGELLAAGMRFLNTFLDTAGTGQRRLYIQAELEQAGFDIANIKKNITINSPSAEQIFEELDHWEKNHIDVETLTIRVEDAEKENDTLRDKVLLLERKIQILQEEKGILISLEQCLKERCSELQDEVISLKSVKSPKNSQGGSQKRGGSSPAVDEGISSSERSLTPENAQRESSVYEVFSVQSETIPIRKQNKTEKQTNDDEEETTIEEVMEELRNIINDAETEAYRNENRKRENKVNKIQMRVDNVIIEDSIFNGEAEIVPSNLHPLPPRKTRSLVHLFIPTEDYGYCGNAKELFFENETAFTSEEGSDSLLSASKCHQLPRVEKEAQINDNRAILNTVMDARERVSMQDKRKTRRVENQKNNIKRTDSFRQGLNESTQQTVKNSSFDSMYFVTELNTKDKKKTADDLTTQKMISKSLDRIDDGLDSMVDIVVTDHTIEKQPNIPSKVSTLSRSFSNVFGNTKDFRISRISNHSHEEKQRMFLPTNKVSRVEISENDSPYYFPRLQEKRSTSSSFLIKRGHTNAGLYSGQISQQSHSNLGKKTDFTSSNRSIVSKVTDYPSGLY